MQTRRPRIERHIVRHKKTHTRDRGVAVGKISNQRNGMEEKIEVAVQKMYAELVGKNPNGPTAGRSCRHIGAAGGTAVATMQQATTIDDLYRVVRYVRNVIAQASPVVVVGRKGRFFKRCTTKTFMYRQNQQRRLLR